MRLLSYSLLKWSSDTAIWLLLDLKGAHITRQQGVSQISKKLAKYTTNYILKEMGKLAVQYEAAKAVEKFWS